jgi:hypothetical protein
MLKLKFMGQKKFYLVMVSLVIIIIGIVAWVKIYTYKPTNIANDFQKTFFNTDICGVGDLRNGSTTVYGLCGDSDELVTYKTYTPINDWGGHLISGVIFDGNLYVLNSSYPDDPVPDSTGNQLWLYYKDLPAKLLYQTPDAIPNIDNFSVSPDQKLIAFVTSFGSSVEPNIVRIIDSNGLSLQTFSLQQLGIQQFPCPFCRIKILGWGWNSFWVELTNNESGHEFLSYIKISKTNWSVNKYNLPFDNNHYPFDLALNFDTNKIAFTDWDTTCKSLLDLCNIRLLITDLSQGTTTIISKASTWDLDSSHHGSLFEPHWVNENMLEYRTPNGIKTAAY